MSRKIIQQLPTWLPHIRTRSLSGSAAGDRLSRTAAGDSLSRTAADLQAEEGVEQPHQLPSPKPFSEMPSPPRLPLIGHVYLFMANQTRVHKMFDKLRQKYGDIYRVRMAGTGESVIIFNPEDAKEMYRQDGKIPKISMFEALERMRKEELGDCFTGTAGLVSQGEEWYEFRQAVQQDMLRMSSALHYVAHIQQVAQELADTIAATRSADGILDPSTVLRQFSLDSIGYIFLESRLGTLQGEPEGQRLIELLDSVTRNSLPLFFVPYEMARRLPFFRHTVTAMKEVTSICRRRVDHAIQALEVDADGQVIGSGLLAKLIRKCGRESSIPAIMAVDALSAGIDTTANTGLFLLYHLASNTEKQEKLHQELQLILPNSGGNITQENMPLLKYLKACQKESQRLLPVVPGSGRNAQVEMTLGGYQVPAGTFIMYISQVTANQEKYFPEPNRFIPERWLRGCPERHEASSFAYLPFGHGPRSCIGRRFAQLELQIMAATLVRRFRMEYNGPPLDTHTALVSRPSRKPAIRFMDR